MLEAHPTPREAVGAALIAAGYPPASYQPPRPDDRIPTLGGCTPGWILGELQAGYVRVFFRPAGLMTGQESYDVQLAQIAAYELVFAGPDWQTLYDRRATGIPALLVRRAQP